MALANLDPHALRCGLTFLEAKWDEAMKQFKMLENWEERVEYFGFDCDYPNEMTHHQLIEARDRANKLQSMGRGFLEEIANISYEIEHINEELYIRAKGQ